MLSIIIINYKMESLTISFVKKELSKIQIPHKTIVVNNAATIESNETLCGELGADLISDLNTHINQEHTLFVLSSGENLGFAKGNNMGVEFCRRHFNPDYILFANNDIIFKDTDVVEQMIQKLSSLPKAGLIGPKVVGLDGVAQSPYPYISFFDKMIALYWSTLFLSKKQKNKRFQLDYPQTAKEGFHYYVMGSFFIVKAQEFYRCGMFDPHTFLYAEELILSERMKRIGLNAYYYPKVCVIHEHGKTTSKFPQNQTQDIQFESDMYYFKEYRHTNWFLLLLGEVTHFLRKSFRRI